MNQPATVFFTGMDAFDAEQLTTLFHETNRRTGNRWKLADTLETAAVLVVDVDTLYGHMTWLRSQNTDQIIVALTTNATAEADFILHRPVSLEAMRNLLHDLSRADVEAPPAPATPAAAPRSATTLPPPPKAELAATIPPPRANAITGPAPALKTAPAEAGAPVTPEAAPLAAKPAPRRLIDALLDIEEETGLRLLELPGLPPLVLDLTQKTFLCSGGITVFLPHTRAELGDHAFTPMPAAEYQTHLRQIGGTQPLSRLIWLAALGGNAGQPPNPQPDARYRLAKWPRIEREFTKHFRIATGMMKGFQTVAELVELSGAEAADVNDFIAASLVSGHAEAEAATTPEEVANVPAKGLLSRLRRNRT